MEPTVIPPTLIPNILVNSRRSLRGGLYFCILALIQIVLGFILIPLDIAGLILRYYHSDYMTLIGANLWTGLMLIFTGLLGVWATRSPSQSISRKGALTGYLCWSIICCIITAAVFSASIPAMLVYNFWYYCIEYDYNTGRCGTYANTAAILGLRITSTVIFFVALVVSMIASAFGCSNLCCSTEPRVQVIYMHAPATGQSWPFALSPPPSDQVSFQPVNSNPNYNGSFQYGRMPVQQTYSETIKS